MHVKKVEPGVGFHEDVVKAQYGWWAVTRPLSEGSPIEDIIACFQYEDDARGYARSGDPTK